MLWRVVASGVVPGHVELVAESGVVSIVRSCQRVVELHEIHYREWSRRAALVATRQRVVELYGICCREWSRRAALVVTRQRVVELHGICCREWSRVVALVVACQRVCICRLKLDWDA